MDEKEIQMTRRTKIMQERCDLLKKSGRKLPKTNFMFFLFNDEYKVMYCEIPKVASTSIKRLFLHMDGHDSVVPQNAWKRYNYDYLIDTNKQKSIQVLSSYIKVIFIRDPLERILSAYINKLTEPIKYKSKAKHIVKIIGPTFALKSYKSGPTFALKSDKSGPTSALKSDKPGPTFALKSDKSGPTCALQSDKPGPTFALQSDKSGPTFALKSDKSGPTFALKR